MAAPVQMTDDQVRDLIAGCVAGMGAAGAGGREKVDKLSSTEPADWRTWRRNFQVAVRINGWSNQRARRTAQCSMTGMRPRMVRVARLAFGQSSNPVGCA